MEAVIAEGHIVAYVLPWWGHIKPLAALLARLVRLSHSHVTFFTGVSVYGRLLREIKRQFLPEGEEYLKSLIRVVGLPESEVPFNYDINKRAFAEAYRALCDGLPIPAMPNGNQVHKAVKPPQLVLIGIFLYESMKSGSISGIIFLFGPEYLGGNGDLAKKLELINAVDENERYEEGQKIYRRISGDLLSIPSLPPMYDYEFSPQALILPADAAVQCQYVHKLLTESDGSIHCTNPVYEGPALEAWTQWLPNGPTIAAGPIVTPPELARIHDTEEPTRIEIEVRSFLADAMIKYGENSVVYVSFGTVFWSTEPEKVWTVIDVLIELNIPFLFAYASPFAIVPDEVKQKVTDSGLGYMSKWLPQQMILDHESCGWFLSHGGQNSTMESLSAGVPIIFWPFEADQPMNAALVSIIHQAGYELIEARQGLALRPMHRLNGRAPEGTVEALRKEATEVLKKARGEDGQVRRMNAQRLGEQFASYWAPDGAGWKELQRIADVLR